MKTCIGVLMTGLLANAALAQSGSGTSEKGSSGSGNAAREAQAGQAGQAAQAGQAGLTSGSRKALRVGAEAPGFELPDQDRNPVSLEDFRGKKRVVLAFYPLAFTPG